MLGISPSTQQGGLSQTRLTGSGVREKGLITAKHQGESAGVRWKHLIQNSGAWPVLCVYKHSYQLSRRAVFRAEYNNEAEKCL